MKNSYYILLLFVLAFSCSMDDDTESFRRVEIFDFNVAIPDYFILNKASNNCPHIDKDCLKSYQDNSNKKRISFRREKKRRYGIDKNRIIYLKNIIEGENINVKWINFGNTDFHGENCIRVTYLTPNKFFKSNDNLMVYNSQLYYFRYGYEYRIGIQMPNLAYDVNEIEKTLNSLEFNSH